MGASMAVLSRLGLVQRSADPIEPWEREVPCPAVSALPGPAGRPFVPRGRGDVPRAALETLCHRCGLTEPQQLLVVPTSSRPLSPRRCAVTPTHVLGLGDRAVGLWVSTAVPQLVGLLPLPEIGAIRDRRIRSYGRLSVHSAVAAVNLRYDLAARDPLTAALRGLRRRLSGPDRPLPAGVEVSPERLPVGWPDIRRWPILDLEDQDGTTGSSVDLLPARHRGSRRALAIVTPFELVLVLDVAPAGSEPGLEAVYLARARIGSIAADRERVAIESEGVVVELTVGEELAARLAALDP